MRPLYSPNSTAFTPATPPRPIAGAVWQAGVTPRNDEIKVLLNGEPVVGAVAASDVEGWVLVQPDPQLTIVKSNSRAPLGLAYRIDPFTGLARRDGRVELVGGDRPGTRHLAAARVRR
jgi:hypothetical protein